MEVKKSNLLSTASKLSLFMIVIVFSMFSAVLIMSLCKTTVGFSQKDPITDIFYLTFAVTSEIFLLIGIIAIIAFILCSLLVIWYRMKKFSLIEKLNTSQKRMCIFSFTLLLILISGFVALIIFNINSPMVTAFSTFSIIILSIIMLCILTELFKPQTSLEVKERKKNTVINKKNISSSNISDQNNSSGLVSGPISISDYIDKVPQNSEETPINYIALNETVSYSSTSLANIENRERLDEMIKNKNTIQIKTEENKKYSKKLRIVVKGKFKNPKTQIIEKILNILKHNGSTLSVEEQLLKLKNSGIIPEEKYIIIMESIKNNKK